MATSSPSRISWLGLRNERTAAAMRAKYDRSIKEQKKLVLRAVSKGRWTSKEVSEATGIAPADCAHLLLELWKAGRVTRFKPIRFGFKMRKAFVYLPIL